MADLNRSSEIPRPPPQAEEAAPDLDAFAELYREHAGEAYALLTRLVGAHPDRDDLLQETFVRLHRALPRFRGESSMATFVHSIAVRVAYDHLRRRRREARQRRALAPLGTTEVASPERARLGREVAEAAEALTRLKPPQRIAFVLREVMNYSYPEIATLCGCRVTTARMRVSAARRSLRRALVPRRSP